MTRASLYPQNPSAVLFTLIIGALLGAFLTTVWSAFADGDPATDNVPRMLPYQGVLELNGEPVHAAGEDALWIQFAIYDGPDAPMPVYTQRKRIEVFSGRFTTTLGEIGDEGESLVDVIQAADDLRLGMTMLNDPADDGDDVALTNRQQLMATPYALWTTSATNIAVARDLSVGGDTHVDGRLFLRNAAAADANSDGALVIGTPNANITLDSDGVVARESGNLSTFQIDSPVVAAQDATIEGDLVVRGAIKGALALRRMSVAMNSSGRYTLSCEANELPISCGTYKSNNNSLDEDSLGCYIELETNSCLTWVDIHASRDSSVTGYCMCLARE